MRSIIRTLTCLLILISLILPQVNLADTTAEGSVLVSGETQIVTSRATEELVPEKSIIINEVMFYPEEGEYEWVELKNVGSSSVDIDGWGLTDEDGNWYRFPHDLPDVPAGAFVVIIFDGTGIASDDLDFVDNVAILHSQSGLIDIFENDTDQVALYRVSYFVYLPLTVKADTGVPPTPGNYSTLPIASFVAWGDAPEADATNAAAAGIWLQDWYVSLSRGLGVNNNTISPGETIGLLPDSLTSYPDDWELFQAMETTPEVENIVPVISWYTPEDGAVVAGSTFAVGWNPVTDATGYHFQLDDTPDFGSPLVDTVVTEPRYVDTGIVPDGVYNWRVQVEYSGNMSNWSPHVSIETITLPLQQLMRKRFFLRQPLPPTKFYPFPGNYNTKIPAW